MQALFQLFQIIIIKMPKMIWKNIKSFIINQKKCNNKITYSNHNNNINNNYSNNHKIQVIVKE